jgi:arylsulfatase A-like enzyme
MEGESLVALMQDPKRPWRDFALSEAPFVDAKAIITAPWKYIHHFETQLVKPDLCDKYRRGRELFNLAEDPDEQRNLYDTHRDNADGLYARMLELLPPAERERLQSAKSIDLSSETRERLKSLGYLQ